MSDLAGHAIGDAGDYHPARAMADEDRIRQVLIFENADDVLDVGIEADFAAEKVRALAEPGQGRRIHVITAEPQKTS